MERIIDDINRMCSVCCYESVDYVIERMYMRKPERKPVRKPGRRPRSIKGQTRRRKDYQLVVDLTARGDADESVRLAKKLERRLKQANSECEVHITKSWDDFGRTMNQAVHKRPYAIVVFGGDSSVRLAASLAVRAKRLLGIVPCGRHNNIFSSLYGHTDPEEALEIVRSGYQRRIDGGLANGHFFLGSLVSGLVPAMLDRLGDNKLPRMALTWSKLASHAADETVVRSTTMKMDSYTFSAEPALLNIHLLPLFMTLRFAPVAQPDDGQLVLVFDKDGRRDIMAHYIRDLKKNKYQYANDVQMIRGRKITLSPASNRKWLIDGGMVEFTSDELLIEVLPQALRICSYAPAEKK